MTKSGLNVLDFAVNLIPELCSYHASKKVGHYIFVNCCALLVLNSRVGTV